MKSLNLLRLILVLTALCFIVSLQAVIRTEADKPKSDTVPNNETISSEFFYELSSLAKQAHNAALYEFKNLSDTELANSQALRDRMDARYNKLLHFMYDFSFVYMNATKAIAKNNNVKLRDNSLEQGENFNNIEQQFQITESNINHVVSTADALKLAINDTSDNELIRDVYTNRIIGQFLKMMLTGHKFNYFISQKKLNNTLKSILTPSASKNEAPLIQLLNNFKIIFSPIDLIHRKEFEESLIMVASAYGNATQKLRELSTEEKKYQLKFKEIIGRQTELSYYYAVFAIKRSEQYANRSDVVLPDTLLNKKYYLLDTTATVQKQIMRTRQLFTDHRLIMKKLEGTYLPTSDEFFFILLEEQGAVLIDQSIEMLALFMEFQDKLYSSANLEFRKHVLKKLDTADIHF